MSAAPVRKKRMTPRPIVVCSPKKSVVSDGVDGVAVAVADEPHETRLLADLVGPRVAAAIFAADEARLEEDRAAAEAAIADVRRRLAQDRAAAEAAAEAAGAAARRRLAEDRAAAEAAVASARRYLGTRRAADEAAAATAAVKVAERARAEAAQDAADARASATRATRAAEAAVERADRERRERARAVWVAERNAWEAHWRALEAIDDRAAERNRARHLFTPAERPPRLPGREAFQSFAALRGPARRRDARPSALVCAQADLLIAVEVNEPGRAEVTDVDAVEGVRAAVDEMRGHGRRRGQRRLRRRRGRRRRHRRGRRRLRRRRGRRRGRRRFQDVLIVARMMQWLLA